MQITVRKGVAAIKLTRTEIQRLSDARELLDRIGANDDQFTTDCCAASAGISSVLLGLGVEQASDLPAV